MSTMQNTPAPTTAQTPATAPISAVPPQNAPTPIIPRPQVSASLYIGDLDPEVGESTLYELFKDIGNVASIRVCRDAITRTSLGYAYVNFHSIESAETAINVLNGEVLKNRPCRIMWSRRDPSIRKSGVGNIFIKNLSPDVDHSSLLDIFSTFGNIHSCKLVTDENGKSKGYGFVHFHSAEAAENAIKKMNNLKLNDKQIYVSHFIPQKDRKTTKPEDVFTNVYIKNLHEDLTEQEFYDEFQKYGDITSACLRTGDDKKCKGFGFVNYATHDQAVACVKNAHDKEFKGKTLYAARAQSKNERREFLSKQKIERISKYRNANLYIKNLDESITEEMLRKEFQPFGTITSAKIMTNEKGVSKGFGFVCFSTAEEASNALRERNRHVIMNKPLYVALAQPKEQRKQMLEAQYNARNRAYGAQTPMVPLYANTMFYPSINPNSVNQPRMPFYPPVSYPRGRSQMTYANQIMPNQNPGRGGRQNNRAGASRPSNAGRGHPSPQSPMPNSNYQNSEKKLEASICKFAEEVCQLNNRMATTVAQELCATVPENELVALIGNEDAFKERVKALAVKTSEQLS